MSHRTRIVYLCHYLCCEIIATLKMEIESPKPPRAETAKPEVPKPPKVERDGFMERRRKKNEAKKAAEQTAANAETTPEAPKKSARQRFKENVAKILFGEKPAASPAEQPPVQPEHTPETPEPPVRERAQRMRRFARVVIATVLGTAETEAGRPKPLDTEPLIDAAADLKNADAGLGEALKKTSPADAAAETPAAPEKTAATDSGGYETAAPSEAVMPRVAAAAETVTITALAAERIAQRIATLERSAEKNAAKAVVATGLGVLAVLFAGHEYFARKKVQRKLEGTQREVARQKETIETQKTALANLQSRQETAINRQDRAAYYQDLSEFTHKQADATRQITREVQQSAPAEKPAAYAGEMYAAHGGEQPEPMGAQAEVRRPAVQSAETAPGPEPLVRTETADKIEQGPSRRDHTGAGRQFGGANGNVGAAPGNDPSLPPLPVPPLSPAAIREAAARKARQDRLRANAWLYGVVLTAAAAIIVALLFLR